LFVRPALRGNNFIGKKNRCHKSYFALHNFLDSVIFLARSMQKRKHLETLPNLPMLMFRSLSLYYSGLFLGISELSAAESGGKIFVGVLMLITALGFGIVALADFLLLVRVSGKYWKFKLHWYWPSPSIEGNFSTIDNRKWDFDYYIYKVVALTVKMFVRA
jgi:hypothetical protein